MKDNKKIVFLFVSIITLCIFLETSARVYLFYKTKDYQSLFIGLSQKEPKYFNKGTSTLNYNLNSKDYYSKYKPGTYNFKIVENNTDTSSDIPYTITNNGFRSTPHENYNKNEVRQYLIAMGESTTMGFGVIDVHTYPAVLQSMVGSQYEVINAGMNGYNALSIANLLKFEIIPQFQPKIIVLSCGVNDVLNNDSLIEMKKLNFLQKLIFILHENIYYKSVFYTLLIEKGSLLVSGDVKPMLRLYREEEILETLSNSYIKNVSTIIELCVKNGIDLYYVIQDWRDFPISKYTFDINNNGEIEKAMQNSHNMMEKRRLLLLKAVNELKPLLNKYNFPIVNPLSEFDKARGSEVLFYDYIHLTAKGNELLAKIIYRNLRLTSA